MKDSRMYNIATNTETTLMGVGALVAALLAAVTDFKDGGVFNLQEHWDSIGLAIAGIGGLLARDGNKSSREVGAE